MVMLGTNDAAEQITQASYESNLSNLCTALVAAGYKVILNYPAATFTGFDMYLPPYWTAINALVNGTTILLGDTEFPDFFADNRSQFNYSVVHPNFNGQISLGQLHAQAASKIIDGTGTTGTDTDPGVANVRSGTTYSYGGVSKTGTCAVPSPAFVLATVNVDATTGTVVLPSTSNVLSGVTFGAAGSLTGTYVIGTGYTDPGASNVVGGATYTFAGTLKTGTCALPPSTAVLTSAHYGPNSTLQGIVTLPAAAQVLTTAAFGAASATTGTVVLPAAGQVVAGVTFGPGGSLTGTVLSTSQDPGAANVRAGTAYAINGTSLTGTCAVPTAVNVLAGVNVDATTGTLAVPAVASVLWGTNYGAGGAQLTGTYKSPTPSNVLSGVGYGANGTQLTGTVTLPAAAQVLSGVEYGPSLSLTGTATASSGTSTDPGVNNVLYGVTYTINGSSLTGNYYPPNDGESPFTADPSLVTAGRSSAPTTPPRAPPPPPAAAATASPPPTPSSWAKGNGDPHRQQNLERQRRPRQPGRRHDRHRPGRQRRRDRPALHPHDPAGDRRLPVRQRIGQRQHDLHGHDHRRLRRPDLHRRPHRRPRDRPGRRRVPARTAHRTQPAHSPLAADHAQTQAELPRPRPRLPVDRVPENAHRADRASHQAPRPGRTVRSCFQGITAMPPLWWITKDGDKSCLALYEQHYSCYRYADARKRLLFAGPGEKIVLRTAAGDACWVWRKFIDACIDPRTGKKQEGINCAFFRNASPYKGTLLIRQADAIADLLWLGQRHYTYVDPKHVGGKDPGLVFLCAAGSTPTTPTAAGQPPPNAAG